MTAVTAVTAMMITISLDANSSVVILPLLFCAHFISYNKRAFKSYLSSMDGITV